MECKVWVFGKGCSVAPGRGRGGDEDGRARAGYPRDFGGGHGGRWQGGTRALSPTAPGPNGTGLAGQCYPCPRIMANDGWRREVSESTPEVSRPSLSPRAALGLCLSSRELRAATAAHRAAISLSRLGGWEWQWEWWVEELTEGTRFERRGEGRKGKVNGELGSKQGTRLITLQRQKDRVKVYGW